MCAHEGISEYQNVCARSIYETILYIYGYWVNAVDKHTFQTLIPSRRSMQLLRQNIGVHSNFGANMTKLHLSSPQLLAVNKETKSNSPFFPFHFANNVRFFAPTWKWKKKNDFNNIESTIKLYANGSLFNFVFRPRTMDGTLKPSIFAMKKWRIKTNRKKNELHQNRTFIDWLHFYSVSFDHFI